MEDTGIATDGSTSCWFVGAMINDQDLTDRFVAEGIWQNGYTDRYQDLVKSIQVGDRIILKSTFTQKKDLPFDSRGHMVSVMRIKAVGKVTENPQDGRNLRVSWRRCLDRNDWYFFTFWKTIARLASSEWEAEELLKFAFEGKPQEIDRFRNAPFWRGRFGDIAADAQQRFAWTAFYEELADRLMKYRNDRAELVVFLHGLRAEVLGMANLDEHLADGTSRPLTDICPFTVMSLFNRGITDAKRTAIAAKLAGFLGVQAPVPNSFEGIPRANNQNSWFFSPRVDDRGKDDIENLWRTFAAALALTVNDNPAAREELRTAYNQAAGIRNVNWKLGSGLYWVRPWSFPPLDSASRVYIAKKLNIPIEQGGSGGHSDGESLLRAKDMLESRFQEDDFPVHSFPELSVASWKFQPETGADNRSRWISEVVPRIKALCRDKKSNDFSRAEFHGRYLDELRELFPANTTTDMSIDSTMQTLRDRDRVAFLGGGTYRWLGSLDDADVGGLGADDTGDGGDDGADYCAGDAVEIVGEVAAEPYTVTNILEDGAFVDAAFLDRMLASLRKKKNLILQGPPGTGKTWLAKRLGYALMGQRDDRRMRSVQFHTNLSYEDFVRGWRPSADGRLRLEDGPFLEMVRAAGSADGNTDYVIVIEEINRGNPAQIFGEMLTLLEHDKRTPSEALELCYRKSDAERVFIPRNLHVIGTMNIADRSLALVDLALRRRFAFITLTPCFDATWSQWVQKECGLKPDVVQDVRARILALNAEIASDRNLGPQFEIGHSYLTPKKGAAISDGRAWFRQVVETEIGPLLEEYWFDNVEKMTAERARLLEGF